MIRIKKIVGNGFVEPERQLSKEEIQKVFLRYGDENDFIYFEAGDEETDEYKSYLSHIEEKEDDIKERLITEVDEKTQELIFNGFVFDGLTFSLSREAQINWSNIPLLPQQFFPLTILSKNDDTYTLTYEKRMNFYVAAVVGKNTHLQSGNILKQGIKSMSGKAELENFKDNRK